MQSYLLPHEIRTLKTVLIILSLLVTFTAGIFYANLVSGIPMNTFVETAFKYLEMGVESLIK